MCRSSMRSFFVALLMHGSAAAICMGFGTSIGHDLSRPHWVLVTVQTLSISSALLLSISLHYCEVDVIHSYHYIPCQSTTMNSTISSFGVITVSRVSASWCN